VLKSDDISDRPLPNKIPGCDTGPLYISTKRSWTWN